MSRPDLLGALRAATPAAPPELRQRVRELATTSSPARRRSGWRLPLTGVALAAVAAAAAAALIVLPGSSRPRARSAPSVVAAQAPLPRSFAAPAPAVSPALSGAASPAVVLPAPSPIRAQSYGATLSLRLSDGSAVAAAARRAVQIAQALGGYPQSVKVSVGARSGSAKIVLRVPRNRVSEAIVRLSSLGRVVGEHVSIVDLQAGVDATGLRIVRLERELAVAIHEPQSAATQKLVAALSTQIEGLQRARAATLRSARDATVGLDLGTVAPPRHIRTHPHAVHRGPFHTLGRIFRLAGIGAVYVLAIGTPLAVLGVLLWLLASRIRRRKEERLLSRS